MRIFSTALIIFLAALNVYASPHTSEIKLHQLIKKQLLQTLDSDVRRHEQMEFEPILTELLQRLDRTQYHLSATGKLNVETEARVRQIRNTLVSLQGKDEMIYFERNLEQMLVSSGRFMFAMTKEALEHARNSSGPGKAFDVFAIVDFAILEALVLWPVELFQELRHHLQRHSSDTGVI